MFFLLFFYYLFLFIYSLCHIYLFICYKNVFFFFFGCFFLYLVTNLEEVYCLGKKQSIKNRGYSPPY